MWTELKRWAQLTDKQPWEMTRSEFEKRLEYHGSPNKNLDKLERYMKGGGDMGGIFTTKNRDYANVYTGWDGRLYYAYPGNKKVLDLTNRKSIDVVRSWIGEMYATGDEDEDGNPEEVPFTQEDFRFLFPTEQGADWATFSHYEDLFMRHGYGGVKLFERYDDMVKSTALFEGGVPVWGADMDVGDIHRKLVEQAIAEGRNVPQKVRSEYGL